MSEIQGSVGQHGDNLAPDVRLVQRLLNRQNLSPLRTLAEDGRSGPATVEAIRHFQTRFLSMPSPDGRVDPGGRTFRRLRGGTTGRGTGESAETRRADRALRAERVDPRVKETAVTTRIIDSLLPHFGGLRARIIGGFLSDSDQFWKVNYHWEYLLGMVDHSLTLPVADADRRRLQAVRSGLMGCRPDPATGYTSGPVGRPEDRSSYEEAHRRYQTLRSAKDAFRRIVDQADLKSRSRRSPTMFDLAAAPVARPGASKHGHGYAVDIQGDNAAVKSLCSSLGATLVFDEQSHVHVEFRNGVSG
jgi:hypothetical protein